MRNIKTYASGYDRSCSSPICRWNGGRRRQLGFDRSHQGIQTAGTKAFNVQGDEAKSQLMQMLGEQLSKWRVTDSRQVLHRNFHARQVAGMIADSHERESMLAQELFCFVDHLQTLGCNRFAVCDTAGQARRRGF